jgi:hypothetical protein
MSATAAVGVLGGLIFTRYLGPIDFIARLTADEVRHLFGPPLRSAPRPPAPPPNRADNATTHQHPPTTTAESSKTIRRSADR